VSHPYIAPGVEEDRSTVLPHRHAHSPKDGDIDSVRYDS